MRRAGFTLVETVVALSLFAAAAVALCQAAVNARNGLMRLDEREASYLRIDWVRDDILAITNRKTLEEGGEMEFPQQVRKQAKEGSEGEDVPGESVRARWDVEILPTSIMDVHQLTITLSLEQGDELSEPLVGSYYVYRPGWYEAADDRGKLLADKQDAWERLQTSKGL